ncbi:EAL domain-containing protein [Alteraurantiacibacter aestuarii]|nr:EAL domain-containing protein [Alteraurantiacibacter aestuarii]
MRHAFWAGLIALVLSFLTVFDVFDQLTWVAQSRLATFEASGDIVYVGTDEDLTDPGYPQRRVELAETLDRLREEGVSRVYIDMVFNRPSTVKADEVLNAAMRAGGENIVLVQNYATGLNGEDRLERSASSVSRNVAQVATNRWENYLGFTWQMPFIVTHRDEQFTSLPASLAGLTSNSHEQFPINYSFDLASIPSYRYQDLQLEKAPLGQRDGIAADVAGKLVVLGVSNRSQTNSANIPGHMGVPNSLVSIYAAETLMAGLTKVISGYLVLLFAFLVLCILSQTQNSRLRHSYYAAMFIGLLASAFVAAQMGAKISIAAAIAQLLIFGLFRARTKWKSSFRMVDPDTNLPTFAALEADKATAETVPTIIVAKIHRFEEVRKTLPADLHAEYLLRIVGRLKAAKKEATIYLGQGHLIAWTFPEKEPALIREHLEGLRALFSSPLLVGENQVDVGITFGVDITPSPNVTRRVAAAVSAAERTTETYEPIEIAELASDEDLIWNISLQARIDSALSNGEIYLIYQPKILVQSGELVGVEALVRWRDPVKGLIPPDHFIRQCENAGRMTHLTRHVLEEACLAGNAFEDRGLKLPIAVNISATLVHERDIVRMVREVLDETGFDPLRLTLEITETYRISNFEAAHDVLSELAALGPKISMDDFGVGAASLEALQRLPFSELKIDRMFTSAMNTDAKAAGIVRHVLRLGKELRIIVVAEGVEDGSTLTLLRDSGCLVAQGFAISRPISFDEILKFQRFSIPEELRKMV